MSDTIEKLAKKYDPSLYRRALRGIVKGYRRASREKKIPISERPSALQSARWAAEDPVYEALERKKRIRKPAADVVARKKRSYALRSLVQQYKQGWGRKKVAPEHRESLLAHAADLTLSETYMPHDLREQLEVSKRYATKHKVALVGGDWFTVDRVKGDPSDGKPYFIGVGVGYDIRRLVVFAYDDSSAIEIAEDTWPESMFDEIISAKKLEELEKEDPDAAERYQPVVGKKRAMFGCPSEDIRIFEPAKDYHSNATKVGKLGLYRLKDGTLIEAR